MSDNETVREVLRQLEAEKVKQREVAWSRAGWMVAGAATLAAGAVMIGLAKEKIDKRQQREMDDRDALERAKTELVEIKTRLRDLERQTTSAIIEAEADRQAEAVRAAFLLKSSVEQRSKEALQREKLERSAKSFVDGAFTTKTSNS